jgi:UDP-glucose 4-epimerase
MKILIVGSKGFIGSYLTEFFRSKGNLVFQADVVTDYTKNANYFLIDSTNSDFKSVFENNAFDVCINCSGAASVPQSIENPLRDYTLNTVNVFKILEAIRRMQPSCKFVNLSSAAVYGNPVELPIVEESNCVPLSPYGKHKLMSEMICKEFSEMFGLQTSSLRIFSAYGEGLTKQLFWDLAQKTVSQNPIHLYGTGSESRDFIYIRDLAAAIECVIQHASFDGQVINVANGVEFSIQEVVSIFLSNFDEKKEIVFGGQVREGDPVNWQADISKLKRLGYAPKYSIEEGLKNYYNWLQAKGYIS